MPELPEVEAARKALFQMCHGRVIVEARVAEDPIVISGVAPSLLQESLTGRTIVDALRKGKNLWLQLDRRPWPSFQFGMTGAFYIDGKEVTKYKRSAVSDKEEWPSKFSKVFFKLDDGLEVSFTDKRRLARVRLLNDPATTPPISELGPDAFLELPEEDAFTSTVLKKKCTIKALLLDQTFLAGIGNWVADEVLYQARVHPEQIAASLSKTECSELRKEIQEVIKLAVDVDADSERFPESWIFHSRWNKKGGEVDGKKIAYITVGGRTSAYVPAVQKLTTQSSGKDGAQNSSMNAKNKGRKGSERHAENSDIERAEISNSPNEAEDVESEDSDIESAKKKKGKKPSKKVSGGKHPESVESTKTQMKAGNKASIQEMKVMGKSKETEDQRGNDRTAITATSTRKKSSEKQTNKKQSQVAEATLSRKVARENEKSFGSKRRRGAAK